MLLFLGYHFFQCSNVKGSDWVYVFNFVWCKGQNSVYMCCLGLYDVCFCVNVYKCAHEHLSMLEGQGWCQGKRYACFPLKHPLWMWMDSQLPHIHTKTHAELGLKPTASSIDQHSVGAERRDNFKSCPLNYGHLLTQNTVCLSAGSHSGQTSPPPHWSTTRFCLQKPLLNYQKI